MSTLKSDFSNYLTDRGVSKSTKKNYLSDLTHFSRWLLISIRRLGVMAEELSHAVSYIDRSTVEKYKSHLATQATPTKTVNRRLSTLRLLSSFFLATQIISFDFMENVINVASSKPAGEAVIDKYKKYLESEKVSSNTVKGYLSDVKQFLSWVENRNHG